MKFRTVTATYLLRQPAASRPAALAALCLANANALHDALTWCAAHGVRAFRVNSQILPLRTHPEAGYTVSSLPCSRAIRAAFAAAGDNARAHGIRLSFHPDQFVLLNSPRSEVVRASLAELRYQAEVAAWIGADVINIHGGGAYGDPAAALERLAQALARLPRAVRTRLTLENDDRTYTPADLLPVCERAGVPLVYDVHHHRCLPDGMSVAEVTRRATATWDREPLFHLSSPAAGWQGTDPRPHADFISPADLPEEWAGLTATVDVEAKAKELAVLALRRHLATSAA